MKTKITLKKKLNNIFFQTVLQKFDFACVLKNTSNLKKKTTFFTQKALKTKPLKILKEKTNYYPLTFLFFQDYSNFLTYLKINLNKIFIFSIKKLYLKNKNLQL